MTASVPSASLPSSTGSTTSSAALSSTSSAAGGGEPPPTNGEFFTGGEATFYAPGLGSCGIESTNADFVAALSRVLFDAVDNGNANNNPSCNRKIFIRKAGAARMVRARRERRWVKGALTASGILSQSLSMDKRVDGIGVLNSVVNSVEVSSTWGLSSVLNGGTIWSANSTSQSAHSHHKHPRRRISYEHNGNITIGGDNNKTNIIPHDRHTGKGKKDIHDNADNPSTHHPPSKNPQTDDEEKEN